MKNIIKETITSIGATIVFAVVLCGIYPLIVWGAGQLLFPRQANGSLIEGADRKIVGSSWLGQPFSSDKYFIPRPSAAGTGYDAANSSGSNLGPTSKKLINGTTKSTAIIAKEGAAPAQGPDVVDYDGIKLRVIGYCEQNGISYELLRDGKVVDPKTFKTEKGEYDQVKLITAFNEDPNSLTVRAATPIPGDAVTASGSGLDPHISVKNAMIQLPRVAKVRSLSEDQVRELLKQNTDGPSLGVFGESGVNVVKLNLALDKLTAK
ncbi:MAG TPA: potassium-transporting ATPase subunit C [Chthoniobacter sp.]|nr:potassium-transporting ATPase subunit C [Chthoniobacter sp.]